jgi:nitrous oxidase accessory protein NosD
MRKPLTHARLAILFLGTFCATTSVARADERVRIVGQPNTPCPNAQYTTINDAVNAADPGDVIEICPALYPEQLTITKRLTLRGRRVNGVNRVLLQPTSMSPAVGVDNAVGGLPFEAVITVMYTHGVTIQNLAIDASKNNVTGCTPLVAGIHYYNSSGEVENNAISGAQVTGCTGANALLFGSGFGVQVDADQPGDFDVSIENNSIHDFTRDGIQAVNPGVTATIEENVISGVGPSGGVFQFGVFIVNGAVGRISRNVITEGLCGTLSITDCINARSEGITLRAVGDGTLIDRNVINDAQSGIFINAANQVRVTNNQISNIVGFDGIDLQGTSNSLIDGNIIFNALPLDNESCGVFENTGPGSAGGLEQQNKIFHTIVNDAYCGVVYVSTTDVDSGRYFNTLYTNVSSELPTLPPPVEP